MSHHTKSVEDNRGPVGGSGPRGPTGPCCTGPTGIAGNPASPVGVISKSTILFGGTAPINVDRFAPANVGFSPLLEPLLIPSVPAGSPTDRLAFIAPKPGTLKNLYVVYPVMFLPGTATIRAEIYVNGIASGILVDIANLGAGPIVVPPGVLSGADLVNTIAVVPGDRIALRLRPTTPIGNETAIPAGFRISAGIEYST